MSAIRITLACALTVASFWGQALAQTKPSPEIQALIQQLSSPDEGAREAARAKLIALGSEARAALEEHVRARSAAEATLAQIQANEIAGGTPITLDLKGAKPQEVFAEIAKQAGVEIQPYAATLWEEAQSGDVTISLDKQPFLVALREACLKTNTGPVQAYSDRRIQLHAGGAGRRNLFKCPASPQGGFMVFLTNIQSNSYVDTANPEAVQRNMSLQMQIWSDPRVRVLQYYPRADVEEVVDDKGQSLLSTRNNITYAGSNAATPLRGTVVSFAVPLAAQKGLGSKIAKFKGTVRLVVQTKAELAEFTDVMAGKEVSKSAGGVKVTLRPITKNGERFGPVTMVLQRDGLDERKFGEVLTGFKPRLYDAEGREHFRDAGVLDESTGGTARGVVDTREFRLSFSPRLPEGNAIGDPAKFTVELPMSSQEVKVAFEFKDVALP